MKNVELGNTKIEVPNIIVGAMRLGELKPEQLNSYIHTALDNGINFFDHADIYGNGASEKLFGEVLKNDKSIKREDLFLQSKSGIVPGKYYDNSEKHILESVDGILDRLNTDYLDMYLIHRPDALTDPKEVAKAFNKLEKSGKVKHFGVSNHNPGQIELLKKYVEQPLLVNQLQFSIPVSNMVASGMEVNMDTPGSFDHDGGVLNYSRLNDMTIQAWSPFQMPNWEGPFIGSDKYPELNEELNRLAIKYGVTPTAIAAAWILRHPANMQLIAGTTNEDRLKEIAQANKVNLSREDWYKLYLSAGHPLP